MNNIELPENWDDFPHTIQNEIRESFGVFFEEELIDLYLRGILSDDLALDECVHESFKYIEEYYQSRQMDEF